MYMPRRRSIHCLFYLCFWHVTGERWEMFESNDDSDLGNNVVEAETEGNDATDDETSTVNMPGSGATEESAELNLEMNLIIRDVAYFLRAHKFQDFDRRFYHDVSKTPKRLYEAFPKPPLRSLHWEVKKYCEVGFRSCLRFLEKIVNLTPLRREDDTVTVMRDQKWTLPNDTMQINATQSDCLLAKRKDEITADPFQGPLERFRWRTSVSYYMCWYTMLGVPQLAHFGESCANYASCLDPSGLSSVDERVDDSKAYNCAMFSFCPDPCCPESHLPNSTECESSSKNPCYAGNEAGWAIDKRTTKKQEISTKFEFGDLYCYYMCWYTMLGVPQLAHFGESCANYASCLDPSGLSSVDERVDASKAYNCAMFSFCPDPCCPGSHLPNSTECESSSKNPCYAGNEADKRTCTVRREDNQDFTSMWKGHLNVTCHCDEPGYEWSTRYGICVDIDECSEKSNRCSFDTTQTCVNLPGYYDCICHLGYVYNARKKACVSSQAMTKVLYRNSDAERESTTESTFERIVSMITRSKASLVDTRFVVLFIPCFVTIRAR